MKLVELLNAANEGYPDSFLTTYYNEETGEHKEGNGDLLAWFIVEEIRETYDLDATKREQIREAIRVLDNANEQLQNVNNALIDEYPDRSEEE